MDEVVRPESSVAGADPQQGLTNFHAKYFAYELTKRSASDSVEKLAGVLADAQVDLNPHQVEAALFAFQNPFSRGAILADEVGLGKTIEAGLLLAQRWAERKRKLLVIAPANLRKQWNQELLDKFHLPSVVMENRSFNEAIRNGILNPFIQDQIVLCSYQFARTKEPYVRQVPWDLVVIDEAHRLRNIYKPSSRIAAAIKTRCRPPQSYCSRRHPCKTHCSNCMGWSASLTITHLVILKAFGRDLCASLIKTILKSLKSV